MVERLVVRRAGERFVTARPGVETRHGFSFGRHYDPAHTGHGRLVVHDEHRLAAGAGFDPHPHRDVEVISWVLAGTLLHEQDGAVTAVPAGALQRMVAGAGVVHAERAADRPCRFVQLWLTTPPAQPRSYAQVVPAAELAQVLPGVHAGRLDGRWRLPAAARAHLYVATGGCALEDRELAEGDAVRLTAAGPVVVEGQARLLVVELPEE